MVNQHQNKELTKSFLSMYLINVWQKNRLSMAGRWYSGVPVARSCPICENDPKSYDIWACVQ